MIQHLLRWLYPGMGVKRWALVIGIFALILIMGLMGLFGRENLRSVFEIFQDSFLPVWALVLGFILVGALGIVVGLSGLLRSILREVAPEFDGVTSEVIFSNRLLSRGPRVVALGGGTGLSTILRGLKEWTTNITAVVTVMDDGGSSGRLRRERHMLPPGDIRNCLIALAEDESRISQLFQHRFEKSGSDIDGHSIGNLVITGLQEMTGSFDRSIEELSKMLNIRGQVLPATLEDVDLVAEMADGTVIQGEENIGESSNRVVRMSLSESKVPPYPKVLEAIAEADVIIMGPGSLYTSIIPNLLVDQIAEKIENSSASKFYVANLMTQPGETDEFMLSDHLDALGQYLDLGKLDHILINNGSFPEELLNQYRADNSVPVTNDIPTSNGLNQRVVVANLLDLVEIEGVQTIKHHSGNLARTIADLVSKS